MMQSLKHVAKSRTFFPSIIALNNNPLLVSSNASSSSCTCCYASSANRCLHSTFSNDFNFTSKEVADCFKSWFKTRNNELLGRIYEILGAQVSENGDELAFNRSTDLALSQLGLRLNEAFVLEVLAYGKDVLSCLKFFDWAGRQPGFYHTRNTFHAIFRIISKSKLMSLMFDILRSYKKQEYIRGRLNNTLVIGYAVAGKPEIALQLFGEMRFRGLDLDSFAYHVLLNALVEENCFYAFDSILKQIKTRGHERDITHGIIMKSFCKQNQLDEAEAHLNRLVSSGRVLSGPEATVLVSALCKQHKFDRAANLVQKLGKSGLIPLENVYGVWIKELVRAQRLNEALEFFRQKKSSEGYVPTLCPYNNLICRLLRKNQLDEVYDLLIEMMENHISPDNFTMNVVFCFFCKAGMVDVALELYNSKFEFGLSPNHMAYKYLILSLCWDGSINEAYCVLRNSIYEGFFPGRETFSTVVNALCREHKVNETMELFLLSLKHKYELSPSTYDKFISALCQVGRVEDGYLLHGELNNISSGKTYYNLIKGFSKSKRGEISARLLIELQEKGHTITRPLTRAVIDSILHMNNSRTQFFNLLEILSRQEPTHKIYNYFIDGAGHAKKPELAREVFEMMRRNGIEPTSESKYFMLRSYLKNERISDAINFFNDLRCRGIINKKAYNAFIIGLCEIKRADIALQFFLEMRSSQFTPTIECYEVLVQRFCLMNRFNEAINLVNDYEKLGRHLSSFLGNVLLLHSLRTPELYDTCVRLRGLEEEKFSGSSTLSFLVGAFSGCLKINQCFESMEELIKECFPLNTYTYNLLLRKACMCDMDQACELFNRICQKGYEPNWWTYDIMVQGFSKHGRIAEAKPWVERMFQNGFNPSERNRFTRIFIKEQK